MLWRVQRVLPNPVLSCSDINDVFTNLASEQGINLDKPKNSKEIDIFWQSMMPLFFDLEKTSDGFGLIQSQELRERVLDILRNGLLVKALKLSNKAAKTSQNMTMDEYIDGLLQKFKATYPEWRCLPFPRLG